MFISEVKDQNEIDSVIVDELKKCGINFRRCSNKKVKNVKKSKIFNRVFNTPIYLLELIDATLSNGVNVQVPRFVYDSCQCILEQVETEGLFRRVGSLIRQKDIKSKLETGLKIDQTISNSNNVIDIGNILKLFFRELPEPLLPCGIIQEALLNCLSMNSCSTGEDLAKTVDAILMICLLLPPLCLNTLAYFMGFLYKVSEYKEFNKMSVENLSIIFTPGIMPVADQEDFRSQRFKDQVKILEILIKNSHLIGIVPDHIIRKLDDGNLRMTKSESFIDTEGQKQQKKKEKIKPRSGSLSRILSSFRRIVGSISSPDKSEREQSVSPSVSETSRKRRIREVPEVHESIVVMTSPSSCDVVPKFTIKHATNDQSFNRNVRSRKCTRRNTTIKRRQARIPIRNQTWPASPHVSIITSPPESDEMSFYPKTTLKRGRPNTIKSGLKQPTTLRRSTGESEELIGLKEEENENTMEIDFINTENEDKKPSIEVEQPHNVQRSSLRIAAKNAIEKQPKISIEVNSLTFTRTPKRLSELKVMLGPAASITANTGRESLKRIRNENAGMVMAKAKIFNALSENGLLTPKRNAAIRKRMTICGSPISDEIINKMKNASIKDTPVHVRRNLTMRTPKRLNLANFMGHQIQLQT